MRTEGDRKEERRNEWLNGRKKLRNDKKRERWKSRRKDEKAKERREDGRSEARNK